MHLKGKTKLDSESHTHPFPFAAEQINGLCLMNCIDTSNTSVHSEREVITFKITPKPKYTDIYIHESILECRNIVNGKSL